MKRKMLPIILMLTAGAVASIITYLKDYELVRMLWILLAVFVIFYLIGLGVKKMLDVFDEQIAEEARKQDEGSVIEKEPNEEDEQNTAEHTKEA